MSSDSVKFKVNVYEFNYVAPGENLVKQSVLGALTKGKNRVSVDLAGAIQHCSKGSYTGYY